MKKSILALSLILPFAVNAEQQKLTWMEPNQREDNSVLPRDEISHFIVRNAADASIVVPNIAGTLNEFVHDFPTGTHNIVMTVVDTEGRESVFSPIVTINSATSPKSVTNFQSTRVKQ